MYEEFYKRAIFFYCFYKISYSPYKKITSNSISTRTYIKESLDLRGLKMTLTYKTFKNRTQSENKIDNLVRFKIYSSTLAKFLILSRINKRN